MSGRDVKISLRLAAVCVAVFASVAGVRSQDYTQQPSVLQPGGSNNTANRYGNLSTMGTNPFMTEEEGEEEVASDTTKRKIRKPLESYFFDDSVRARENFIWHVDMYKNKINFTAVDTALALWQLDYPYQRKGVGDAYQGPLGGASIPLDYADRPVYNDFSFAEAYDTYFFFPTNTNFYNVKRPFTQLTYLTAGQKKRAEEIFGITHAQNISPSSGFNIDYHSRGTKGMYRWQRSRAKNLSAAFSHTGKKYSVHAGYIYNAILNRENGGLPDDRYLTVTQSELSENLEVSLKDATNTIKNNTYYVIQSYGIPLRRLLEDDFSIADRSSIFFGHAFEYSRWVRNYGDSYNNTIYNLWQPDDDTSPPQQEEFYENWYINPNITYDSIFESRLSNRVFIQLQPFDRDGIVGVIDAGVGMDNHVYYQFTPDNYLKGTSRQTDADYYAYGGLTGKFRHYFDWGGDLKIYPAGRRSGDLYAGAHITLGANIKEHPVSLTGKFHVDRRSADYWSTKFFSNHFKWENSFDKETETRLEARLSAPTLGIELGFTQSLLTDKLFYNRDYMPEQYSGNVSVTGVYAQKDFRLGGFHLNHRVLLQWSTEQEVVPVPLASAFLSYYFEFNIVRNVLRAQLGVDARYNTKYYAPGWQPALARFYNQREKQIGNYPKLDAFFGAKWKRMRIMLKMEHVSWDMIGSKNAFAVLHHPLNQMVFKYGISWTFYD